MKSIKQVLLNSVSIMSLTGAPSIQYYEMAPMKLKSPTSINRNGLFKTHTNDVLNLRINQAVELTMLENAELDIKGDVDKKQTYQVHKVDIKQGKVHIKPWKSSLVNASKNETDLIVVTDFFQMTWKAQRSYAWIIESNKDKALLTFCNVGEEVVLQLFDHEEKKILKKNQSITFQGVKDGAGIAFDLLLSGRKAPKGNWGKIATCDDSDFEQYKKTIQKKKEAQVKAQKKLAAQKRLEQQKLESQFDCLKPMGKINQCWFEVKGDHCLRRRCNAEGLWMDETKLHKEECSHSETVRDCSY